MRSKIFLLSLFLSFVLIFMFFCIFRVDFPEEVNITESEVYLIDELNNNITKKSSVKINNESNRNYFSLPGIYQKIPSKKSKYSVKTYNRESDSQLFNPLDKLKKIEFDVGNISAPIIQDTKSLILDRKVSNLTYNILETKNCKKKLFEITGNIKELINEEILQKELKKIGKIISGEFGVYLRFYTKDTFLIEVFGKQEYKKNYMQKLKKIIKKSILYKNISFTSKKISGKIYLMNPYD